MARTITLREQVADLRASVSTLTEALTAALAASPAQAVEVPAPEGNAFISFLGERHAAALKAGTHVKCEQTVAGKRCTGVMNAARTTTLKGKRACKRHF